MPDFFAGLPQFFDTGQFQPHGYCLSWNHPLVINYIVSDSLIALSYYSIPFGIVYFTHKRRDLDFKWIYLMFAVFIIGCGTTHVMDVVKLWSPNYWLDAGIRHLTATVSVATAVAVWLLLPKALLLPSPAQLSAANRKLQAQIAERERVEQELRRVNALLGERSAQLETLNQELESFSYSVSHDLRAPLRGITGFSQVLNEDYSTRLDDAGRGYLTRISTAAERMGSLIDGLLNLARLSRSELKRRTVDLTQVAREIVTDLKEREPQRRVEVGIQENALALGDAQLLTIVLENLLGNAWKFTSKKEHPSIEFGFETVEDETIYFVKDNGAGFDANYSGRLFGAFQRLHKQEDFEGTGIGLATVQRIIHRHGGRIWAESKVGEGATFRFTLGTAPQSTVKVQEGSAEPSQPLESPQQRNQSKFPPGSTPAREGA